MVVKCKKAVRGGQPFCAYRYLESELDDDDFFFYREEGFYASL